MTTALRRLELDYCATRSTSRWISWLLLALAIGFIADLGVSYHRVREAIAESELRLAKLERDGAGSPRARVRGNVSPEEIASARETYLRLATPWNALFGALESTPSDKVILEAIEPDPKAGTVRISGEARDYPAVLEYVAQLQSAKNLNRAHLIRHELRQNDPQRPVAFSISAYWSEAQ